MGGFMVEVSGVEKRGDQPSFFEAKEPSRFQRVKDWVMANPDTLLKVGVVFAIAMTAWPIACVFMPAIGLGIALGVGIPLAIGSLATLPLGITLMDMRA